MGKNETLADLQREATQLILELNDEQIEKLMQDMMNENVNPWRAHR